MRLLAFLTRLMAILALIGLASAPVAPSIASSAIAMPLTAEMPDGMPCCPDDQPLILDCGKDCPFAAVCTAVFGGLTTHESTALAPRMILRDRFPTPRDAALSSLISDLPPRPPKA